jgi:hypothetical protein
MKMLCLVISLMTNFKIAIRAFLTCIPKSAFTSYVDTFHIKSSILVVRSSVINVTPPGYTITRIIFLNAVVVPSLLLVRQVSDGSLVYLD